jgi:hypothetical protein
LKPDRRRSAKDNGGIKLNSFHRRNTDYAT